MIAYFDASAIVKLVIEEDASATAERMWTEARRVVVSVCAYPEAQAALARAARDRRLDRTGLADALGAFEQVWRQADTIGVSHSLAVRAGALARQYPLSGYDAVHLASAEAVQTDATVLVAADRQLLAAARRLGMAVVTVGARDVPT